MKISASQLRENIYRILDKVIETGAPVEINRKGKLLKIIYPEAPTQQSKIKKLKKRRCIVGDPESLIHIDWSSSWSELE